MSYQVQQGNLAGRLGQGLGQGLAEQVPQEMQRYRLSEGLNRLTNPNQTYTPIEQYSNLIRSGASPEQIQQILPLLERANANRESRELANQGNIPSTPVRNNARDVNRQVNQELAQPKIPANLSQENIIPNQNVNQQDNQPTKQNIVTAQPEQEALNPILPLTTEERRTQGAQYRSLYPNKFKTQEEGEAEATKVRQEQMDAQAAQIKKGNNQENLKTKVNTGLENAVQRKTQKPLADLFKHIPGEFYNKVELDTQQDILKGLSSQEAIEKQSDKLLALDKKLTSMENGIGSRPFWGKTSNQLNEDIEKLRPTFEKFGAQELFKDKQKEYLDLGDHRASYNAYKPNKKLEEEIINISSKDTPEQIAARIGDKITDKDSLFSIGYLLNKVGVDDSAVINELAKMKENGLVKLDDRQDKEAIDYYPLTYSLGDILWSAFTSPLEFAGYKTGKLSHKEKVKRYMGKE